MADIEEYKAAVKNLAKTNSSFVFPSVRGEGQVCHKGSLFEHADTVFEYATSLDDYHFDEKHVQSLLDFLNTGGHYFLILDSNSKDKKYYEQKLLLLFGYSTSLIRLSHPKAYATKIKRLSHLIRIGFSDDLFRKQVFEHSAHIRPIFRQHAHIEHGQLEEPANIKFLIAVNKYRPFPGYFITGEDERGTAITCFNDQRNRTDKILKLSKEFFKYSLDERTEKAKPTTFDKLRSKITALGNSCSNYFKRR